VRKFLLIILVVSIGFFAVSCGEPDNPNDGIVALLDLVGTTETEIIALYQDIDLNIIFIEVETNDVAEGEFIRYVNQNAGDFVTLGSYIQIEIAVPLIIFIELLDVSGKTENEIIELYEDIDLVIQFVDVETNEVEVGKFISYVDYEAGDDVQAGATVQIEIAVELMFTLLDLTGLSTSEILTLYSSSITISFVIVETNAIAEGLFVSYVDNEAGDEVSYGTAVQIQIATPLLVLLDLTGKTESEITALYTNLEVTLVFELTETNDVESGKFVSYQQHVSGEEVSFGSTLTILIATPILITLQDLTGMTQAMITTLYAAMDLDLTFIQIPTNQVAIGKFIRYVDYASGNRVPYGTELLIEIAVELKYTLPDLTGMTQTEISELFSDVNLVIVFRPIVTDLTPHNEFIQYVTVAIGDQVSFGSTVRIQIAQKAPAAPTILGADEVDVYVSVQGNPPTFDVYEGVTAVDYLGNTIPQGGFFFIVSVEDTFGTPFPEINFYLVKDYIVTYQAINSNFTTTVERIIHVIVPPFDTNHTDGLRLTALWTNKSFVTDAIGEVTVTTFTDADTTNFRDTKTGQSVTVRYLGIDAPEATSKYDPWGIKAATFVKEKLTGAEKIILQAEGERMDGNGRYLAWVWYVKNGETRLLNLELVEQAYAFSNASLTQYGTIFTIASAETQLTGRRIYGEIDEDYDYSTEGTPVAIGDLLDDFDNYIAKKVLISGVITSKVGNSIFLEQNGRGIYIYAGYSLTNELQIGYEVTIQGLVPAVYFESKQLSNYKYENMKLESVDNPVPITTIMGDQISGYVGRVVRFENLTVSSIDPSPTNNGYTVYLLDDLGNVVNIRVDDYTASFLPSHMFVVGSQLSVFGPVAQFYTNYQLMLPGIGNIVFK
jgi:endonuclease YncB( thermonuclease family)